MVPLAWDKKEKGKRVGWISNKSRSRRICFSTLGEDDSTEGESPTKPVSTAGVYDIEIPLSGVQYPIKKANINKKKEKKRYRVSAFLEDIQTRKDGFFCWKRREIYRIADIQIESDVQI